MGQASTLAASSTGLMAAGGVLQASAAYAGAKSQKQMYKYQAAVNENNAVLAEWNARDALSRGARAEQLQKVQSAQLEGRQRASLAARGVSLRQGSPLAILQDTEYLSQLDTNTIRDNAAREAWGYRTQAAEYRGQAGMYNASAGAIRPWLSGTTSLLGSAGSVASQWYRYKQVS